VIDVIFCIEIDSYTCCSRIPIVPFVTLLYNDDTRPTLDGTSLLPYHIRLSFTFISVTPQIFVHLAALLLLSKNQLTNRRFKILAASHLF
jgi:hypothetical protein